MKEFGSKTAAWDYENLNGFLGAPQKYIAGTKMSFVGLKKPEDRINMIAYLHSLGATLPIPAPAPAAAPAVAAAAAPDSPVSVRTSVTKVNRSVHHPPARGRGKGAAGVRFRSFLCTMPSNVCRCGVFSSTRFGAVTL
jgi:hypothetical protein